MKLNENISGQNIGWAESTFDECTKANKEYWEIKETLTLRQGGGVSLSLFLYLSGRISFSPLHAYYLLD